MSIKYKRILTDYLFAIAGTFFLALGLNNFLVPLKLSSGGISSLATILYHFCGIPLSVTNLICNAVLFVFGYKYLGKNSVLKTVTGILAKIAPFTIKNVNDVVESLTLSDVFDTTTLNSGVFKLLDQSKVGSIKIVEISEDFTQAINDATLGDLESAGLITADVDIYIDTDLNGSKETLLSDMKLNEFVDVAISILSK